MSVDRDAVAATLTAYLRSHGGSVDEYDFDGQRAMVREYLAPLLAQARAEAVAAALAPVERLADEWDDPSRPFGVVTAIRALRAVVAEGKEAGRG